MDQRVYSKVVDAVLNQEVSLGLLEQSKGLFRAQFFASNCGCFIPLLFYLVWTLFCLVFWRLCLLGLLRLCLLFLFFFFLCLPLHGDAMLSPLSDEDSNLHD